jgi:cation diffusion facilitator CzcD-associated flavoprotein CzcO
MESLADKRVGIIGTGATAVQAVPRLAEAAQQLYVFQRTPSPVGPRLNPKTDPEWFAAQEPGWQQRRIDCFTALTIGEQPEDIIGDGWGRMLWVDTRTPAATPERQAELDHIDFMAMQSVRDHIASVVEDPETATKLQPWYGKYCKRLCFHDQYLQSFNRDNVQLVDTDGHGVQQITELGPVVDGVQYEVDCLIYASGFEVMTDYWRRIGFDPVGRDGVTLSREWAEGPHTLHGVHTRGFPNLLMLSTIQGGQALNFLHTITATALHIAWIIEHCAHEGITAIEPTPEAEEQWFQTIFGTLMSVADYNETCTPGYLTNEGEADMRSARCAAYLGRPFDFISHIAAWRDAGGLAGLTVGTQR